MKDLLRIRVKALALIAILLLSVVGGLSAQKIAIIDAGSSGSRLYVYEIKKDNPNAVINLLYPSPNFDIARSQDPKGKALSEVGDNQRDVNAFMSEMTSKYQDPENETIDLYVLATAGMRLVNGATANEIYNMMERTSLDGYKLEKAMTISGRYEGLYAWIAANYRNGKLKWDKSKDLWSLTNPYGILEIGGASMQIAFIAPGHHSKNCIAHSKFGQIYSKSYLGGGADQVFEKNSPKLQSYFGVILDDIEGMFSSDTKFIGLGTPIRVAFNGAGGLSCEKLRNYADTISVPDSKINYHPKINAEYMAYVFKFSELDGKIELTNNMSDWTEGAAIDIVINGKLPEAFNYSSNDPN